MISPRSLKKKEGCILLDSTSIYCTRAAVSDVSDVEKSFLII